jgi:hypothetical protein
MILDYSRRGSSSCDDGDRGTPWDDDGFFDGFFGTRFGRRITIHDYRNGTHNRADEGEDPANGPDPATHGSVIGVLHIVSVSGPKETTVGIVVLAVDFGTLKFCGFFFFLAIFPVCTR